MCGTEGHPVTQQQNTLSCRLVQSFAILTVESNTKQLLKAL
eukprot:COSAG06_NODE_560_length_14294_cov_16.177739_11_plen_41_part_00